MLVPLSFTVFLITASRSQYGMKHATVGRCLSSFRCDTLWALSRPTLDSCSLLSGTATAVFPLMYSNCCLLDSYVTGPEFLFVNSLLQFPPLIFLIHVLLLVSRSRKFWREELIKTISPLVFVLKPGCAFWNRSFRYWLVPSSICFTTPWESSSVLINVV